MGVRTIINGCGIQKCGYCEDEVEDVRYLVLLYFTVGQQIYDQLGSFVYTWLFRFPQSLR